MSGFDPQISRTTTAMLAALHDPEAAAVWEAFDARYRPVLHGFARNLGLPDEQAADVAQETIVRFVERYREGRYERGRGRLGAWMVGIARNAVLDLHRRRRRVPVDMEDLAGRLADDSALDDAWRRSRRETILQQALVRVRDQGRTDPRTIEAFELSMLRGVPVPEVARSLGMSVDSIYAARTRVARRLQDAVKAIEADFDEED